MQILRKFLHHKFRDISSYICPTDAFAYNHLRMQLNVYQYISHGKMQSKRLNKFSNRAESQFPKLTTHSISKACNSFHLSFSIGHKFHRHFQFSPQTNNSIYTDRSFALSKTNQYSAMGEVLGGPWRMCRLL